MVVARRVVISISRADTFSDVTSFLPLVDFIFQIGDDKKNKKNPPKTS